MKRVQKIGPVSLAKVLGALYALLGFIFGFVPLLVTLLVGPPAEFPTEQVGFIYAAPVLLAIFYGLIGAVSGFLGGLLYNLIAKWVGGVEVELEKYEEKK